MADYSAYAEDRLRIWRRVRQEAGGVSLAEFFRPAASELRFRLGTSLADLRIPFRVGAEVRGTFARASLSAYLLAGHRHKASLSPTEYDRLVVTDGFDPNALRPLSFSTPSAVSAEHTRRAFTRATESHAGLDAGTLASFLGTGAAGRSLAALCHGLLAKAREEGRRSETAEPTVYLLALMLRTVLENAFQLTREGPIGEPAARFVRSIMSCMLSEAMWLAIREAGLLREANLQPGATPPTQTDPRDAHACLRAAAALGLIPCLGPRPAFSGSGLTAYGVSFEAPPPRVEEAMSRLANTDDPELVARDMAAAFLKDSDQQRKMERAGSLALLREKLRELARLLDTVRGSSFSVPGESSVDRLLVGRETLERLFASEARRKELVRSARDAMRDAGHPGIRERLELLAYAAREYREDDPAAWLGPADARLRSARAVTAMAADLAMERAIAATGQTLLERTGTETEAGGAAEYESGRLYDVSAENRPLLRRRIRAQQVGHLFCDLKDFTRRTTFLKESVITDFLQREFYTPMLALASGIDPGSRAPVMSTGISLNNLLGDAASFSGDIGALVKLARDIRAAFRAYDKRLAAEASQEAVAARVSELENRYRARKDALERNARELMARAPHAEPALASAMLMRAQHARAELARLDALFTSEKALAVGEKIESGIFISFGTAPEVARFEDPVFGAVKVAIAEKINESARGTARNAAVRERVEALRQRASRAAGRQLELPFSVLVDTPNTIPIPAAEALAVADLIAQGQRDEADARLFAFVRQALEHPVEKGDIFNGGVACSEEALNAYLEVRSADSIILPREMPVAALHESIRERFFFPRDPFRAVAVFSQAKVLQDLFVFQGRALFRGFEGTGGLGVYEMVDRASPLVAAVVQHHVPGWLREQILGPNA